LESWRDGQRQGEPTNPNQPEGTGRAILERRAASGPDAFVFGSGVDIRIMQLMLGHASIQQTQRYLNVTDEELRRGLEVSWKNEGRPLRLASGS
jgi:hypothetical protein